MLQVHMTLKSRNAKTGPIPVSTTTAKTCPTACPFNNANAGGCYADAGPLSLHWRKVTDGRAGTDFDSFLDTVAGLPDGQLWRHNQAGDLPGDGDSLDIAKLDHLVAANLGKRGFTYTHKPIPRQAEREAIARANARGFTVNLSGNTLAHADYLAALDIAPVVCVLPADATENTETPAGRKVIVCPATQRDGVSCATCGLCAVSRMANGKPRAIVGFPAHGPSKRKADAIARA
jgi:hypothetical protein